MTKCPECGKNMKIEKREISHGIYAQVEVCSNCQDEWVGEDEYERLRSLFKRKAFKIGGSLAVRIPKEIADVLKINDGSNLSISAKNNQIIIEKVKSTN